MTTDIQNIEIFIKSNGVHTDIVLPIKTPEIDWSNHIRIKNTLAKDTLFKYIAIGWGDKGFYLETPSWEDLKFSVAFKAAFGLSSSAIHTTYYYRITETETCKKILITDNQYKRLVIHVLNTFKKNELNEVIFIKTNAIYSKTDAFYEANGSYSLFKTCNTWTNNALKIAGQKACFWTPFESEIINLYK